MTHSEPVRQHLQALIDRIAELQESPAYLAVANDPDQAFSVLLRDPTVAASLDRANLSILFRRLEGDDSAGEVKLRATPDVPVWIVRTPLDVESLRRQIAPGQVWVRWDAMTRPGKQRSLAVATAAVQHRLIGGELGAAGASRGPRRLTAGQAALVADADAGGWGYARTHQEGVTRGVWPRLGDERLDSDRAAYARVKRLRDKAAKLGR